MLRVKLRLARGGFALAADFEAPMPGVTALFGPSGAGKSTLIDLIAGLLMPDEGRVEVDGVVLTDAAAGRLVRPEDRGLGYVFQDARLFPHLSVEGNLRYGERRQGRRGDRGPAIGFDQVVNLLGLGSLLRQRPWRLSGGERQRVALGRALLARPRLLLLDEPLASLDAARREEVLPYLERLRDELRVPMVLVSHQFEEVLRLATHVVLVEGGRTTASGSLTDVATSPAMRALVGTEAVGAVLEGSVEAVDVGAGTSQVRAAGGSLVVPGVAVPVGHAIRLQVLARDVIIATRPPVGLSVRNALAARITAISAEASGVELIELEAGADRLLARLTHTAVAELALRPGLEVWALVKAASLRGAVTVRSDR